MRRRLAGFRVRLLPLLALTVAAVHPACDGGESDLCPPAGFGVCDPLEDRCCAATEHCILGYSAGSFFDHCIGGAPEAAAGASCNPPATSGPNACAAGLVCLLVTGVDPAPVCHALCRTSDDCAVGTCSQELSGVPISACVAR